MDTFDHVDITTVLEPYSTCFEPSNLWTSTMLCSVKGGGFAPRAAATLNFNSLTCPLTILGPPTDLGSLPAYKFSSTNEPIPLTIGDSTYSVELYAGFLCRASANPELSGQTVTFTVSTKPLITTEAVYDRDIIWAEAVGFGRIVYEASGKTSECRGNCPVLSNPLAAPTPTPTPAPTGSYVPPPSHPTTQFSPAPSCLSDSNLWLVSTSCQLLEGREILKPSWLECAITELGEPDISGEERYRSNCDNATIHG
ncbi:hypothetical protein LA080_007827 [Diaporthe eres]|nr:hypothetical protein LA080_007827 [Diaporthe eres]